MELEKRRRDLLETYKCVEKDYNQAYKLGNQHGLEYKVKRTDLLES